MASVTNDQNVRLELVINDFISSILGESSSSRLDVTFWLEYSDNSVSEEHLFRCSLDCVDGQYSGNIDLRNTKTDTVKVYMRGTMFKQDSIKISKLHVGDLVLRSEINDDSRGIVSDSCAGTVFGNVFFGKAGVGKSTVASLVSTVPGMFAVGTSGHGTTTLGTWLSSSLEDQYFAHFASETFVPVEDMPTNIPILKEILPRNNSNLVYMDTEGLDYQTEFGVNYDVVTILPHALISENVFLVVRDRINPVEIIEVIEKLATAAERTEGSFSHRNGKLFGRFHIIVNKAQSISQSDEAILANLKENNPSLITKIAEYFVNGPEVITLPSLEWDYAVRPDFNAEGFFLDYEDILLAHPPLRDRMFYGLHKISEYIINGTAGSEDYKMTCSSFEKLLEQLYEATTEDIIDINQLDYEWLLEEAKKELGTFVQTFDIDDQGLTIETLTKVCPESDSTLVNGMENQVNTEKNKFHVQCLNQIDKIFPAGKEDLVKYLDDVLFPMFVADPIETWFTTCEATITEVEMYSSDFLTTFESSAFFVSCKNLVAGKLRWKNWEECSKSCKADDKCGVKIRIADECVPSYSICKQIQIQTSDCNCNDCPDEISSLPIGSIIPWVPKPNKSAGNTTSLTSYPNWVKCNGIDVCLNGPFKGQACFNLEGRALIGSFAQYRTMEMYDASLPNHDHPHTHTTQAHNHRYRMRRREGHCGMGGTSCGQSDYEETASSTTVIVNSQSTTTLGKITKYEGHGQTTVGELYSKHLRVDYIFKCA